MANKTIRFIKSLWGPKLGDSDSLSIEYEIKNEDVDSDISSKGYTDKGNITIDISRSLQKYWDLDITHLENYLIGYAKEYASSKVESSSDLSDEYIQLTSYNAPKNPPVDPQTLTFNFPMEFQVKVPELDLDEERNQLDLASDIIDARDNINAIFGEKYGDRLLTITQERALFELSRPCKTREEFFFRTSSLAELAKSINTSAFGKYIDAPINSGSIDKLGLFMRNEYPNYDSDKILETIAKFNKIRRMYPVHTDRSRGVLDALNYFDIEYPVEDFQRAIERMLKKYLECLNYLLSILKSDL